MESFGADGLTTQSRFGNPWQPAIPLFYASHFSAGVVNSRHMSVNLGLWDKLSRVVIFLLFVAGVLAVFFWYLPLIQENERYRKRIFELDAHIQEQERLGRQLRASIEAVQNDPRTVERLARERLGWARTNETVIRFENSARK